MAYGSARGPRRQVSKPTARNNFKLRRTQLFGPWGVGAILPCPGDESIMISGLDAFPVDDMPAVKDKRLADHIGVRRLLAPPEQGEVPASRFPRWLYCPKCGLMQRCKPNQPNAGKCQNGSCKACGKQQLIPERFVVACRSGHIDDLPIMEWVHGGPVSDPDKHAIKRITKGGSALLDDIVYKCQTCGKSRSLKGITQPGALASVSYSCKGSQPWLWRTDPKPCNEDSHELMVVQRGGTNVWYPDVFSSIYIPDGYKPGLLEFVSEQFDRLSQAEAVGMLELFVGGMVAGSNFDVDSCIRAYHELKSSDGKEDTTEGDYRFEEYRNLTTVSNQQKGVFEAKVLSSSEYASNLLQTLFESVTLVTTLRETRALVGFSRLLSDANAGKSYAERRATLSNRCNLDWTLAIQATGEGVFLKFDKPTMRAWSLRPEVLHHFATLQRRYNESCRRKGRMPEVLNPEYALIHTIAHVLMLGLSKECGYSTASLRERVYCDRFIKDEDRHEDMLGLLIYTAGGDSEGSLGGLVRAGRPGRFEEIADKAVSDAKWCSSDPVCIESHGQGPESCNLAACYGCVLVPETSCENGNKILDRALLVGSLGAGGVGILEQSTSGMACEPAASSPVKFFHLDPCFENALIMTAEGYAAACKEAMDDAYVEEIPFLDELSIAGDEEGLEVPCYGVLFKGGCDEESFEASLVWRKSRVALVIGSEKERFQKVYGAGSVIDGWTIVAPSKTTTVDVVVSRIRSIS